MRWRMVVLVALSAPSTVVAQGVDTTAVRIRLADAIGAAQRNSAQALQAHGEIQAAVIGERAAYAAYLPNVSVGLNTAYSTTIGGGSRGSVGTGGADPNTPVVGAGSSRGVFGSSTAITASLAVFDGGRRIHDVRAARAGTTAAEAGSANEAYTIALDVNRAYYNALAAREAIAAGQSQLALADSAARIANLRTRLREATVSDSLRAAIAVADARLAIATAVTNLASANATLSRLVASPMTVTADPADTGAIGGALPDTATLRSLADVGPAVAQAAAQQTVATEQQKSAKSAFLPQVDATYSFTGNAQNPYFGLGAPGYGNRLGVAVSFPILDQFQREGALQRAQIAALNAGASAKDARLAAREQLAQALGALQLADVRASQQALSVLGAQADLKIQLERYAIGEATIVDVLTSQSQLTQARSALVQARFDYRVARAQIAMLIGRPL